MMINIKGHYRTKIWKTTPALCLAYNIDVNANTTTDNKKLKKHGSCSSKRRL